MKGIGGLRKTTAVWTAVGGMGAWPVTRRRAEPYGGLYSPIQGRSMIFHSGAKRYRSSSKARGLPRREDDLPNENTAPRPKYIINKKPRPMRSPAGATTLKGDSENTITTNLGIYRLFGGNTFRNHF